MLKRNAEDCRNMQEIRNEIDSIDKKIISYLEERFKFVKKAAEFKSSRETVRDTCRLTSMLELRREWAIASNLNPDVVEKMFIDLIEYFISEEMDIWTTKKKN